MTQPEPLPGTHLAEVDCMHCGRPVLAVPQHADNATCAGCGRREAGAHAYRTPPPDSWFGNDNAAPFPRGRGHLRIVQSEDLPWTASCPHCPWTWRVGTVEEVWPVVKLHFQLTHDPKGWLSGKRGGITDPWGRR